MADGLSHNRKCALDTVTAQVSGAHTDFPVLLTRADFPDEMFDPSGSNNSQSDGGDVRLTSDSAGNTDVPLEIVSWEHDTTSGAGDAGVEAWAKFPNVRDTQVDTVYVWYDTPGSDSQPATTAANGRDAVWSGTIGAWQLDGVDGTDSKGNTNLTFSGSPAEITGPFGISKGVSFTDSTNDAAETDSVLSTSQDYTIDFWARRDAGLGQFAALLQTRNGGANSDGVKFEAASANDVELVTLSGGSFNNIGGPHALGGWAHIAIATADGNGTQKWWFNAAVAASATDSRGTGDRKLDLNDAAGEVSFGRVVIWTGLKSDNWITTEYNNQFDPAAFISVGTPQSVGGVATLQGAGATHAHAGEGAVFDQIHDIAIAAADHAQPADNMALAQIHDLVGADTQHADTAAQATLAQQHSVAVDAAVHAHTPATVSLGGAGSLFPASTTSLHVSAAVGLAQIHDLIVPGAIHGHVPEAAVLVLPGMTAPGDRTLAIAAADSVVTPDAGEQRISITTNR